jgi:hypothetical protein
MKLRALASSARGGDVRFGQLCLSGMIINVPTDLARIQVQFPRNFSVDDMVTMNLKRKRCYKKNYAVKNVRPFKIVQALRYLISHDTLSRNAGVQLRPEFHIAFRPETEAPDTVAERAECGGGGDCGKQPSASEDEVLSEGELVDVHSYGEETMIDDGLAEADVRDAIINVAPGEDQRPLCLYLDEAAEEMAARIFSMGELAQRIATRTSSCVVSNYAISEKLCSVLAIFPLSSESSRFRI